MWHLQQAAENEQQEETEAAGADNELSLPALGEDRLSHADSSELSPELRKVMGQFSDEPDEPQAAAGRLSVSDQWGSGGGCACLRGFRARQNAISVGFGYQG